MDLLANANANAGKEWTDKECSAWERVVLYAGTKTSIIIIVIEQFVMHAFDGRLPNCYLIKWINWLSWGLIIYFITFLFNCGRLFK